MTYSLHRKSANKVNELFFFTVKIEEMADLILVEDLYKDDRIKSAVDKASTSLFIPIKPLPDPPFLLE